MRPPESKLNRARNSWPRARRWLATLGALGGLIGSAALSVVSCGAAPATPTSVSLTLKNVVDGDTIQAEIGPTLRSIRVHGIDTPETRTATTNWGPTTGAQKLYGDQATEYARTLLENQPLTAQIITTDQYDRLVARIFAGAVDFAIAMVRRGLARVFYISLDPNQPAYFTSDTAYVAALYEAQADAYINHRGFWSTLTGYNEAFPAR